MKWQKRGLIYGPDGRLSWAKHSALQPTPLVIGGVIRVYVGFRDEAGVSRVGYVDVDAKDPSIVLKVSQNPVMDVGVAGMFDENGVVPCAVVRRGDDLYLYYAGYQLGQKVKFYVFGGLAVSTDGGESFIRRKRIPICDRTEREPFFRVIHSIMFENGHWRVWYGGGDSFSAGDGKQLPRYDIRHMTSADGETFPEQFTICIPATGREYRVGRPYVRKATGGYEMFFGAGTVETGYRLAYATSADGIDWIRRDDDVGIGVSSEGWDSRMQAYPSVITIGSRTYLFYNGNDYGREGFGYAARAD